MLRRRRIKKPIQGLLDRQHFPKNFTGLAGFVVDVPWALLQPTPSSLDTSIIDAALAQAAAASMRVKLRIGAGIDAPEWAKRLSGDPITLYYTNATVKHAGETAGTIGRFWQPAFQAAYADLQTRLAATYDNNPRVAQTCITMAGTIFSETYLRNAKDPRNITNLLAAGFTRSLDEAAHEAQMQAHTAWKRTRSSLTFNPYQAVQPDGSVKQDLDYTLAQMARSREVLGRRAVLENYSLSESRPGGDYGAIYAQMQTLGPPFDFQTATLAKVGSLTGALDYAASLGACSVELPAGYDTDTTADVLAGYQARLQANPTG